MNVGPQIILILSATHYHIDPYSSGFVKVSICTVFICLSQSGKEQAPGKTTAQICTSLEVLWRLRAPNWSSAFVAGFIRNGFIISYKERVQGCVLPFSVLQQCPDCTSFYLCTTQIFQCMLALRKIIYEFSITKIPQKSGH